MRKLVSVICLCALVGCGGGGGGGGDSSSSQSNWYAGTYSGDIGRISNTCPSSSPSVTGPTLVVNQSTDTIRMDFVNPGGTHLSFPAYETGPNVIMGAGTYTDGVFEVEDTFTLSEVENESAQMEFDFHIVGGGVNCMVIYKGSVTRS